MKERMLAGDPYIADDAELNAERLRAMTLAEEYNATSVREPAKRRGILEQLFGALGPDAEIRTPFQIDYGYPVCIGARFFSNFGLVMLDVAPITIGDDVFVGPNVQLLTATHPVAPAPRRAKIEGGKPIVIEDNVWLGGGVIVLPGVTIGANTVVGAGAVVTKSLPPNVVAVGNPARVVRSIT
ncbi:MAG: sugar O-acetyltransferase [Deltaproteobacteria bacterium]|nr:sugar O-acetyltransferase [Deltaproteobacteria bacterium]